LVPIQLTAEAAGLRGHWFAATSSSMQHIIAGCSSAMLEPCPSVQHVAAG
jgi:hypothetical protein